MILLLIISVLILPRTICAYIDPGTGSYVFQILIAALVAVGFALKIFWSKIKNIFRNVFNREKDKIDK